MVDITDSGTISKGQGPLWGLQLQWRKGAIVTLVKKERQIFEVDFIDCFDKV